MKTIVAFSDGETWSMAEEVIICEITEEQFNALEQGDSPRYLKLEGLLVTHLLESLHLKEQDNVSTT